MDARSAAAEQIDGLRGGVLEPEQPDGVAVVAAAGDFSRRAGAAAWRRTGSRSVPACAARS